MKNEWSKILVFGLLFAIGGFLIGRWSGHGCCDRGDMGHGHSMCAHGSGCCTESGHCDKPACDHVHGGDCCTGGAGGHSMLGDHPGDAEADAIAQRLEVTGFIGDTTIAIQGGEVHVVRSSDNMSVHVEKRGPEKMVVEKEIIHTDAQGTDGGE